MPFFSRSTPTLLRHLKSNRAGTGWGAPFAHTLVADTIPNTVSDSAWFNLESRNEGCYHLNYATSQGRETLRKIKECENPYEILKKCVRCR